MIYLLGVYMERVDRNEPDPDRDGNTEHAALSMVQTLNALVIQMIRGIPGREVGDPVYVDLAGF